MGYWDRQPSSRVVLNQYLQYTGSSSIPSTNFGAFTHQVRVISQVAGYLAFGPGSTLGTTLAATAQSSSMFIPASTVGGEYFIVEPGTMCAFISTSTSTGIVNITEMT
jgi:hypothetical protein